MGPIAFHRFTSGISPGRCNGIHSPSYTFLTAKTQKAATMRPWQTWASVTRATSTYDCAADPKQLGVSKHLRCSRHREDSNHGPIRRFPSKTIEGQ